MIYKHKATGKKHVIVQRGYSYLVPGGRELNEKEFNQQNEEISGEWRCSRSSPERERRKH